VECECEWANVTALDMVVNRHKYFRWTPRTAWINFVYVLLVPGMLGTAGYMTEVSCVVVRGGGMDWTELIVVVGEMGYAWEEEGGYDFRVLNVG
jgi:hypothetical protein